jgi:probable addiction module antidote protein
MKARRAVKPHLDQGVSITYDSADFLDSPAMQIGYLNGWFEEFPDDIKGIACAIGEVARARGMTDVARQAGLSRESLYRALGESGNPSFDTILRVMTAMGLEFRVRARKKRTLSD